MKHAKSVKTNLQGKPHEPSSERGPPAGPPQFSGPPTYMEVLRKCADLGSEVVKKK
jgi:hypothetical protein